MVTTHYTDEKDLLLRLQDGEHAAFEAIYARYGKLIAYKLHKLIKLEAVVEELHQDVFLRLWKIKAEIRDDTDIKAYLLQTAKNLSIDFYRKATRDKNLEEQLALHLKESYDHIEAAIYGKETEALLQQLIAKLPPQRQQVFRMIKIEGKSYEYAAQHFGVSMSTIKDHMAKAMNTLKQEMLKNHPQALFVLLAGYIFN